MHEASISEKAARIILEKAKQQKAKKVLSADIVIGELSFFNPEQVEFWIKTILEGTLASGLKVNIHQDKAEVKCNNCGYKGKLKVNKDSFYHIVFPVFSCPKCKSDSIEITKGKECMIKKIEMQK